ncbi:sulfate ABC transporter permease [Litoribacter ruber]|uniref:sulfate ABC transporter permease n=1 Tax=Litoribacter ruber TaxID=702568 RepID=UPI001BDA17A8|nr:sulfate ABC transporter permease [Litoribacter ruber]MBT0812337.1 sulfate ABC transporter permease [Litoribacter ruber]
MAVSPTNLSQRTEELINFDKRIFFAFLVITFILLRYLTNILIIEAIPGSNELGQDGTFTFFHIFNTLNYLWTPFALLWKFTLTAFLLWIGTFLFGFKVKYGEIWKFVLVAEMVFILPDLIRLLYFAAIPPDNYWEIRNFHPFSIFSFLSTDNVPSRFHYPLQAINLFEVSYWFLLAIGIHTLTGKNYKTCLGLVLSSYLVGLLLWLAYYAMVYKG